MEPFAFCEGGIDNADRMQLPMVEDGPSVKADAEGFAEVRFQ